MMSPKCYKYNKSRDKLNTDKVRFFKENSLFDILNKHLKNEKNNLHSFVFDFTLEKKKKLKDPFLFNQL
jgi:hypothetical protein